MPLEIFVKYKLSFEWPYEKIICQMLEVEINSIRWNLSDLCSVAFVRIVIFKLLSRLGS